MVDYLHESPTQQLPYNSYYMRQYYNQQYGYGNPKVEMNKKVDPLRAVAFILLVFGILLLVYGVRIGTEKKDQNVSVLGLSGGVVAIVCRPCEREHVPELSRIVGAKNLISNSTVRNSAGVEFFVVRASRYQIDEITKLAWVKYIKALEY